MERTNNAALERAIKQTRKEILDLLELVVGESAQWPLVRSRVLSAFGRNGLEKFARGLDGQERNGPEYEIKDGT